jgi:general secretion pathway protein M
VAAYDGNLRAADELAQAVARNRVLERSLAELKGQVADLARAQPAQAGFLQAANESLASAQLQNRVKSFVESVGGEMRSTQTVPSRDEGAFRRIVVRAQMAVSNAALQRLVYDIEATHPLLFLENVDIRSPPPATRTRSSSPSSEPMLDVRFDVVGFIRKPA